MDDVGKVFDEPLNGGMVVNGGEIDDELGAMEIEKKSRKEFEAEKARRDWRNPIGSRRRRRRNWRSRGLVEQLEESTKRLSQMSIEDENGGSPEKKKEDKMIVEET